MYESRRVFFSLFGRKSTIGLPMDSNEGQLKEFQTQIKNLSLNDLDPMVAEYSMELQFLIAQLESDRATYSADGTKQANDKIFLVKEKLAILNKEVESRRRADVAPRE